MPMASHGAVRSLRPVLQRASPSPCVCRSGVHKEEEGSNTSLVVLISHYSASSGAEAPSCKI